MNIRNYFTGAIFILLVLSLPVACKLSAGKENSTSSPVRNDSGKYDLLDVKTPRSLPSQIKHYTGFTLSFNAQSHTPNWVAWSLDTEKIDGPFSRSDKFWQDDDIDGCPSYNDYKRSGFDRGHMCPAADNKLSQAMMDDSFVMANMCPQAHALNSGAWKTLESKEREWVRRDKKLYIVAGPIYTPSDSHYIGSSQIKVPSAFFKVIIAPEIDSPRGIGFIYPNMTAPGNMQNYSMTIDQVEEITGLDFFHNLPDELENTIESQTSFREWNKR